MTREKETDMKKRVPAEGKKKRLLLMEKFTAKEQAQDAVRLLRATGIKASTKAADFGKEYAGFGIQGRTPLFVWGSDHDRAREILDQALLFSRPRKKVQIPPQEGTPEYLDMLIHDCRQYLMIATGELKSIEEEGTLDLDEPTNDLFKLMIRLRRLKDQCMRQAGRRPLDWQR